jgi:surface antigen
MWSGKPMLLCGFAVALCLCGCNGSAPPVAAVPVAPPPAPGVVGAAIGRELDERDKNVAIAAQHEAVNSGMRKSWKGGHGAYGFVTPEPEDAASGCRGYLHKIFIAGRPQEARGQACKEGESWRVVS